MLYVSLTVKMEKRGNSGEKEGVGVGVHIYLVQSNLSFFILISNVAHNYYFIIQKFKDYKCGILTNYNLGKRTIKSNRNYFVGTLLYIYKVCLAWLIVMNEVAHMMKNKASFLFHLRRRQQECFALKIAKCL